MWSFHCDFCRTILLKRLLFFIIDLATAISVNSVGELQQKHQVLRMILGRAFKNSFRNENMSIFTVFRSKSIKMYSSFYYPTQIPLTWYTNQAHSHFLFSTSLDEKKGRESGCLAWIMKMWNVSGEWKVLNNVQCFVEKMNFQASMHQTEKTLKSAIR